jgi:hypothetical protein
MREIHLGSETYGALFARLCEAVRHLGGSISEAERIVGGSQEIVKYRIELPSGTLEAESETYAGLVLRGADELVVEISRRVL